MPNTNFSKLKGSYTPVVVPFSNGEVDYDDYARLCNWLIENGTDGLLPNATSGEPTTLTLEERYRLAETAMKTSAGRVPVCAGTASQSHAETIELIERYDRLGVDSMVIVTPYYCRPPDRALVDYFADVINRTERPVLIYHIPSRAAVSLNVDTIAAIKEKAPNFAGLKNTDDSTGLVTGSLHKISDFRIFSGMEQPTLPMKAIGGCGAMISVSNVIPDKVSEICRLFDEGNAEGAQSVNDAMSEVFAAIAFDVSPITTKYMVKRRGVITNNEHRLPMTGSTPELEKRLDGVLDRAGLI